MHSKIEDYWEEDNLQEEYIAEQFIIHFGGESYESSDEEDKH